MGNSHDKKKRKDGREVRESDGRRPKDVHVAQDGRRQPDNTNRIAVGDHVRTGDHEVARNCVNMREKKGRNPSDLYQSEKVSLKDSRPVQVSTNSRPTQQKQHLNQGQSQRQNPQTQLSQSSQGNPSRTKFVQVVAVGGTSRTGIGVVNNPSSRKGDIPTRKVPEEQVNVVKDRTPQGVTGE